jgi:hypothetical protein
MIVDLDMSARALSGDLTEWSAAEVLDTAFSDGLTLRALVCRLGAGKWQWSISALGGDRGELIGTGLEKSLAAARATAVTEIAKCLDNPLD